jgi:putative phosphotransacetylase
MTEARTLKANVPVRESGDLEGSAPVTLVNPLNGNKVDCPRGMIIAKRHIHMTPEDAENFHVKNGDIVAVKIVSSNGRSAILGDTVVRVSPSYALAMHIDTDESNAVGGAATGVTGTIVKF